MRLALLALTLATLLAASSAHVPAERPYYPAPKPIRIQAEQPTYPVAENEQQSKYIQDEV